MFKTSKQNLCRVVEVCVDSDLDALCHIDVATYEVVRERSQTCHSTQT